MKTQACVTLGGDVVVRVELTRDELLGMGIALPEGQPSAVVTLTVDMVKVKRLLIAKALRAKGKRATMEDHMLVVEMDDGGRLFESAPAAGGER